MRRTALLPLVTLLLAVPAAAEEASARPDLETRLDDLARELADVKRQLAERQAATPVPDAPAPAPVAAADGKDSPWTLGGYGEILVSTRFFGPDPSKEYDASSYRDTEVDLARVVLMGNYDFTRWLSFHAELEIEHGGTGVTMEQEWDEFGEYELEVEKGGEVVLEQAFLEARFGRAHGLPLDLGLRVGHLLVPVGSISYHHLPIHFAATRRPESEEALLPSTWHETGAEFFLEYKGLSFQLQGITGLDSTGFSSARWIAGGTQRGFEAVRSSDWAVAARLEYAGVPGLLVGGSFYTTNSTRNRPKRDMDGIDARVLLGDLHVRYHRGPFRLAAQGMMGRLGNADLVTQKNASLAAALGAPRTPVGSAAYGAFLETALDVVGVADPQSRQRLDVFARYDLYDTMWKPPQAGSGFDNPLLHRQVLTTGLNWFPHPRVVVKAEYVSRWVNKDRDWARRQQEVNFALGFVL